jgi:hypothetical protein
MKNKKGDFSLIKRLRKSKIMQCNLQFGDIQAKVE